MDAKVSRKERRLQPDGPVDVLIDNIFDFYPIFADSEEYIDQDIHIEQDRVSAEERKNLIMDIEMLDNDQQELLDRAMFALVKQRGNDPVEPGDGIQWAEAVVGEVPSPVIVQQVHSSVSEEGPGVRAIPSTVKNGERENLIFTIALTNAL